MRVQETKTMPLLAAAPAADLQVSAETLAPPLAGRFVLLYRLGRGGMGEVYAAYDPELDRKVAVKVVRSPHGEGATEADVRREARSLARLNHPNVVQVYDVVGTGEELAIAMELIEGCTLSDWLAAGRLEWREILATFVDAGRGLAAAHAAGVVHRDFKPSNVMLTGAGEVRVVDFGTAHSSSSAHGSGDATGARLGTPAYLAPERLGSGPGDERSDQFSFCVALYEAVTGRHPFFDPADRSGSLARLRAGRFLERRQTRRLPGWLERALARGLRPAPEERFASMKALLAVLERGLRRRRRVGLAGVVVLLVAGAGLAGSLLAPRREQDLCGGAERQLAGVWDAERKTRLRAGFEASGFAFAAQTWPSVEAGLDRYTAEWLAMKRDACEATHRRGEQSEQVLDLRMLCLAARLAELRVVGEQLAAADRDGVERASEAIGSLSPVSECGPSLELTALAPLPRESARRARIEAVQAEIFTHEARYAWGRPYNLALVETLVEQGRGLGYAPLTSRALALQARALGELGRHEQAKLAAEEALWAAIEGEDRPQQARLYGFLVELTGYFQAEHAQARWWKHFAEAAITGLGGRHPEIEFLLQTDLSRYALSLGEGAEVVERTRRALELGERLWGADDLRLAPVHNNLGSALSVISAGTEGTWHLERALAIQQKQLGADNPRVRYALINLASHHAEVGGYEEALALALRALRLLYSLYSDGGSEAAYPETATAQILLVLDRPTEAEEHARTALRSAANHLGSDQLVVVLAQLTLGRALMLQDRSEEAGAAFAAAEKIERALPPGDDEPTFELLEARGQWFLERGRPELARGFFARARVMGEALPMPPARQSAALGGLGETELALGRSKLARGHLEAALALARPELFPLQNARLRWTLARALPPEERERARALAEQALAELPGTSPWSQKQRGEIERWLAITG